MQAAQLYSSNLLRVLAVDAAAAVCADAKQLATGLVGVQVNQLDVRLGFEELHLLPGSVQMVSAFYTLHHLTEPEVGMLFQRIHVLLVPRGSLAIAVLLDQITPTFQDGGRAEGGAVGASAGGTCDADSGADAGAGAAADTHARSANAVPLSPVLRGMYRSFASAPTLLAQLAGAGFTTTPAQVSSRPPMYQHEFPCDRCYILATKC